MKIQVTTVPDARLVATATRRVMRRPVLIARVTGWALLLLTVSLLVVTGELEPMPLAGGALLALALPVFLHTSTARQAARSGRLTTYEISEQGLASSSAESRHAYTWKAFRSVERLSGQLLFGMGGARFVPVPTGGLSAAQIDQVLAAASAGGLRVG
ncbi:hypothetical protein Acsp01_76420 [Actinoplanes sp. NBRC 101535]|nr:hypothetical protein Acsp01_76420 [Actinoplanes sp. NBRC 101535]